MTKIAIGLLMMWGAWWCFRWVWRIARPIRSKVDSIALVAIDRTGMHGLARELEGLAVVVDAKIERPVNLKHVLIWVAVFAAVGGAIACVNAVFSS